MQFGINSMSEWLLIAQGEAECNYANHAYILLVYNLQQIASHWPISELLHLCTVDSLFFNQLESYYTFCTAAQPISELLHFLHVQEKCGNFKNSKVQS